MSSSDSGEYSLTDDILNFRMAMEAISHIAQTKQDLDAVLSKRRGVNVPVKEYQRVTPIEIDEVRGCAQKFEAFNLLEDFNHLRSKGSDFDLDSQEKRKAEIQRAEDKVGRLTMLKEIAKHTAEMQLLCEVSRQQNQKKADYSAPRTIAPESRTIFKDAIKKLNGLNACKSKKLESPKIVGNNVEEEAE